MDRPFVDVILSVDCHLRFLRFVLCVVHTFSIKEYLKVVNSRKRPEGGYFYPPLNPRILVVFRYLREVDLGVRLDPEPSPTRKRIIRPIDDPARTFDVDRVSEEFPRAFADHDRRPTAPMLRVVLDVNLRDVNYFLRHFIKRSRLRSSRNEAGSPNPRIRQARRVYKKRAAANRANAATPTNPGGRSSREC